MTGQGAMAPIAGHTGTGHQAQRTAVDLTVADGVDVVTDFHPDSETQRTLLYGSNFVEIQPSTTGSSPGSSQTFTFSNDVDAIGDMYVRVKVDVTMSGAGTNDVELPSLALARLIDRAEIMVGNSTWQTMENADIIAMAATQLDQGAFEVLDSQARGKQIHEGLLTNRNVEATSVIGASKRTLVSWFPLHSFTTGGPARAHLVAGAPHQSVRVKLTYAKASAIPNSALDKLEVQLWNRQHIMTNTEREQIRNNTVAKTIHLTQHAEESSAASTDKGQVTVELDSFSLLASHLIITSESDDDSPGTATAVLKSAELLLNTSTHSGVLQGPFMLGMAASSMGLQTNLIDAFASAGAARRDFYVFPIASTPFGADGCPMNRFDTIRLKLNYGQFNGKVHVTCVGTTTAVYKNQAASVLYFS